MKAAFSQVIRFIGLGSSWSQPLLANRPSQIVGIGAEDELQAHRRARPSRGRDRAPYLGLTSLALRAVPSITPLRRAVRQAASKSPGSDCRRQ